MNTHARFPVITIALSMVILAGAVQAADTPTAAPTATATPTAQPVVRKPAETIRMITFKLKDGRTVTGRITSDDRGQVTVAEIQGSIIVPSTYSRLDMEPRSISYQSVSEYQYWMTTGQYFENHTWDWQDDADEFAQALRCYQTAQDLATAAMGKDSAAALDADARVQKVLASRQKWIETAKPRAEMAELELKSTLAQRLDNINKSITALQADVKVMAQAQSTYDASLANYQRDVNARLTRMSDDIRAYYDSIRNIVYVPGYVVVPPVTPVPSK